MTLHGLVNESLAQKAKNLCVDAFLKSDSTHFLFIDSDIGFTAKDVLSLLYLVSSDQEKKYDVLAGPCPRKTISWEKLKCSSQEYNFIASSRDPFSLTSLVEVSEIGTGFMMIPRRTFEKFMQDYPKNTYKDAKGKKQFSFFDCAIDPDTKFFMTEDRLFCRAVRKMGGRVWMAPWLRLIRQGAYPYEESFALS